MYAEGTASYSHTQEGGWSRDSDRGDLGVLMHRGSRVSRGVFLICWLMNSGWYEPERRSKTLCTDELYIEAQTFLLPCFLFLFCVCFGLHASSTQTKNQSEPVFRIKVPQKNMKS